VAKLVFRFSIGLLYMLRDSSSVGKLLENGTQYICGGLFLLGKEIAVDSTTAMSLPRA